MLLTLLTTLFNIVLFGVLITTVILISKHAKDYKHTKTIVAIVVICATLIGINIINSLVGLAANILILAALGFGVYLLATTTSTGQRLTTLLRTDSRHRATYTYLAATATKIYTTVIQTYDEHTILEGVDDPTIRDILAYKAHSVATHVDDFAATFAATIAEYTPICDNTYINDDSGYVDALFYDTDRGIDSTDTYSVALRNLAGFITTATPPSTCEPPTITAMYGQALMLVKKIQALIYLHDTIVGDTSMKKAAINTLISDATALRASGYCDEDDYTIDTVTIIIERGEYLHNHITDDTFALDYLDLTTEYGNLLKKLGNKIVTSTTQQLVETGPLLSHINPTYGYLTLLESGIPINADVTFYNGECSYSTIHHWKQQQTIRHTYFHDHPDTPRKTKLMYVWER